MSTPTGVVAFDPAAFRAAFPAFTGLSDAILTGYFAMACIFLNNSPASVVQDLTVRAQLLNLITAHLAFLMGRASSGDGSSAAVVGQMVSAGEGTVNASFAQVQSKNAEFWAQSQYGLTFWQMVLPFRTFRYFPAPHVCR
ncbi:DUF4054 domain-containing protein [Burkholderia stabilis]|uniref:DUF4054 domain-containing protein n=1 Tax=Burkholderia stabilis TaxID=95485 RepID=A0AAJ5N7T1_9BURK|nr:DUF4054 domain-containing protein [Burkholderia stabilis]VBB13407.1 hypothetical protein BSTAB16_3592 [Burkholderia stabilis]